MFDIAVIGAGPAGYSAALNARKREKSVIVIGQNTGWLTRAERIDNYAGMPGISGQEMLAVMRDQAKDMGAELRQGVVHQVIDMGGTFALSLGADFVEARKIILCTGAKQPNLLPGEEVLLGRGVSYCGTCDGMLYRGKSVAVIGAGPEAVTEANFLMSIYSLFRKACTASRVAVAMVRLRWILVSRHLASPVKLLSSWDRCTFTW